MITNNFPEKIDAYIRQIPSLPVSVKKVLEICNNVAASPSDLNKVISLDPVLTGKLIKLINSAYYGVNIKSLIKAITMLGTNTVKNLALSTAILSTLQKNKEIPGLNMDGFWQHCLSVAVTSKLLAARQGIDSKYHQEYFTAGLLHDIGKIPLNATFPADYMKAVMAADREHKPLFKAEDASFGLNHCNAGEIIAKAWNLDSSITDVIAYHHDIQGYSGNNMDILRSVSAADYFSLVHEVGFAGNRNPEKYAWETTGINKNMFEEMKEKVFLEIEKAKIFLKI